jgi:hypothetical protein
MRRLLTFMTTVVLALAVGTPAWATAARPANQASGRFVTAAHRNGNRDGDRGRDARRDRDRDARRDRDRDDRRDRHRDYDDYHHRYDYYGYPYYYDGPADCGYGVPPPDVVIIRCHAYNPPRIRIRVGEVVDWSWHDFGVPHTVTADDGSFDSGSRTAGDIRLIFDHPGEFTYHCRIHPYMAGSVIVD